MPNKNAKDKSDESPEQELEAKVDAMMDPRAAHSTEEIKEESEALTKATGKGSEPEIDIFSGLKTAPEIPGTVEAEVKPIKDLTPEDVAKVENPAKEPVVIETSSETPIGNLDDAFEDSKTDEAVEEITKEESDKVLEAEDAAAGKKVAEIKKPPHKHRLKAFFKAWWENKIARNITIFVLLLGLAALAVWPTSRYFALNTAGVRSSASFKVLDESTGLPLKNVQVSLGQTETKTDKDGVAKLNQLKLGPQELTVERVAFAPIHKKLVIGWGSNPLGDMSLHATGVQYTFVVSDYASSKPVSAEATSGEASAVSDKNGKIVLTLDDPGTDTVQVAITASEYRTEKLSFDAKSKTAQEIKMVPNQPLVYISKQSGKYDLYKVDVDGKNKILLLAGTGKERQSLSVAVNSDGTQAALVSSRGPNRDKSGFLLDTLTLVDLKTNTVKTVDEAQNVRLVNWVGKRLVYSETFAAPSAATGNRQRIIAYNTDQNTHATLATSDSFNGVVSDDDYIYYAIASSDPTQQPGLYKIKVDGSGKQTVLAKQIWSLVRIDIDNVSLETPDAWYDYKLGDITAEKGDAPADAYASRQYVHGKNGKSLWAENRDGKGVLLVYDAATKKDTSIVSASGVGMPVRWLNSNTVVYRVANNSETADYVKSLNGGQPKKVVDVTNASGLNINY